MRNSSENKLYNGEAIRGCELRARQLMEVGKIEEAMSLIDSAYEEASEDDYETYATICNTRGIIYLSYGDEVRCMGSYLNGLRVAIKHDLKEYHVTLLNNIGAAFQELFDHEQALKYFQQARELVKEVGEENLKKGFLFILYCNLSVEYEALGDYASAERSLQETEKHMDDIGVTGMEMAYQIAKCKLALRKGQSDKVMEYYNGILDEILHWDNMSYFWLDIELITEISIALERYDDLYKLVKKMEETTGKSLRNVSNFYRKLYVQELNIRYYEFIHDEENLQKAEIEYGRLCRKQTEDLLVRRCQGMSSMVKSFENELEKERMNRKIENDQLTGCGNRYKLRQDAPEMITNGIMDNIPIALGIIDVDYFKYVNDTYGHLTGDEYLNLAAKIIRQNVGDYGEVYRYGGDEFVVMLIAEEEEVHRIAKKIKDDILEACLPNEESPEGVITVSQGWVIDIAKVSLQLDDLIRKADRKLYIIKKTGRNGYAISEE